MGLGTRFGPKLKRKPAAVRAAVSGFGGVLDNISSLLAVPCMYAAVRFYLRLCRVSERCPSPLMPIPNRS